jgi:hypothetical protein
VAKRSSARIDGIADVVWWFFALGIGIAFVVLGETPGRILGIVFTSLWIVVGVRALRRWLREP